MDWGQIHLALNHVPVIAVPLSVLMLVAGWWRKSEDVIRLALWFLAGLAAAAIAIKFTGDFAAEQSLERFAPVRDLVMKHEQAGDQVTSAVFVLGLAASVVLFLSRGGRPVRSWMLGLVVSLGMVASVLYARSAHSGGQISHPELRSSRHSLKPTFITQAFAQSNR